MSVQFDQNWSGWLRENISRGCAENELIEEMCRSGFDRDFAIERLKTEPRLPIGHAPVFRTSNRFEAEGHWVGIRAAMTRPPVAILDSVITPDEAAQLIAYAQSRMERSTTVDDATGEMFVHEARTSSGAYFVRAETPLIEHLERRFAAIMGLPPEHGEGLQLLRYGVGGEYRPHHDYFNPEAKGASRHTTRGGQRISTMVVYLNDVTAGGETIFPELGLSATPQLGGAAYFAYAQGDGQPDPRLLHASAPVRAGEKWVATKWMRASRF